MKLTKFLIPAGIVLIAFISVKMCEKMKEKPEWSWPSPAPTAPPPTPRPPLNISGLQIEDLELASGQEAELGNFVTIRYKTLTAEGISLDEEKGGRFKLGSGDFDKNLELGIVGMKAGGKRRLTISPPLLSKLKTLKAQKNRPKNQVIYEIDLLQFVY